MRAIELSLSEEFHRSKRNLLLASAATTVLAISRADPIKIPGLGVDAHLPPRTVFMLLLLTILYMASVFVVDFLTMRARNSQIASGVADEPIHTTMHVIATSVKQDVETLSMSIRNTAASLDAAASQFHKISANKPIGELALSLEQATSRMAALETTGQTGQFIDKTIKQIAMQVEMKISDVTQEFTETVARMSFIEASQTSIDVRVDSVLSQLEILAAQFRRLSRSISGVQRSGFVMLQGFVPLAAASFAGVSCLRYIFWW